MALLILNPLKADSTSKNRKANEVQFILIVFNVKSNSASSATLREDILHN